MKLNVTGTLKVSKTFMPLLRNKRGKYLPYVFCTNKRKVENNIGN